MPSVTPAMPTTWTAAGTSSSTAAPRRTPKTGTSGMKSAARASPRTRIAQARGAAAANPRRADEGQDDDDENETRRPRRPRPHAEPEPGEHRGDHGRDTGDNHGAVRGRRQHEPRIHDQRVWRAGGDRERGHPSPGDGAGGTVAEEDGQAEETRDREAQDGEIPER